IVQQVPGTKFVSCSQPANDRQVASVIATLGNTSGRLNGIEVAQAHLFYGQFGGVGAVVAARENKELLVPLELRTEGGHEQLYRLAGNSLSNTSRKIQFDQLQGEMGTASVGNCERVVDSTYAKREKFHFKGKTDDRRNSLHITSFAHTSTFQAHVRQWTIVYGAIVVPDANGARVSDFRCGAYIATTENYFAASFVNIALRDKAYDCKSKLVRPFETSMESDALVRQLREGASADKGWDTKDVDYVQTVKNVGAMIREAFAHDAGKIAARQNGIIVYR
ncbi:MAG TPA: hypothetical protein VJH88_00305, partial [Candidatus Nanoarchaeia archaeon]|nr:hypothetical protein [Candidatus Nanoarchaeia archaeon]